ncbi:MAG: zinc ribbon domain-containing protein [Anaerolineales bacterium]
MPIYTYRCENCGVRFERQQSFSDQALTRCPECNKNKLRKVITPSGIIFKGSGWYATDNKSKSGAVKPTPVKTGSETKSEGKSESKEATPTASVPSASSSDSGSSPSSSSSNDSGPAKSNSSNE